MGRAYAASDQQEVANTAENAELLPQPNTYGFASLVFFSCFAVSFQQC